MIQEPDSRMETGAGLNASTLRQPRPKEGAYDARRAYAPGVTNIATTASAITPVHSQPNILSLRVITSFPMMSGCMAISIMTAMIGTEMTPLITALQ
jgi:hypothetical protein